MRVIPVTTLDLPELEPYRTLRARTWHWREGFFVAEGEKVVRALLDSRIDIVSILTSASWLDALEEYLTPERLPETVVHLGEDAMLEGIVGYPLHQKLLAIGRIPPNPSLEELHTREPGRHVHVALEGLADAENMGMILRNAAAFGARGLIWGSDSTSPWLRRSVRVSLGNLFSLRIHRADSLHDTLRRCREGLGWCIVGTTPRGGDNHIVWDEGPGKDENTAAGAHAGSPGQEPGGRAGHLCLLFGSEAEGLSDEALALCDRHFTIPMHHGVDSINVANAVAVSLFEAVRSRQ